MTKEDKQEYKLALKTWNNSCAICGMNTVELHHIIYRSHGGKNVKENIIPLCKLHHMLVHSNEKYWVDNLLDLQRSKYGTIDKHDLKKHNKWEVANEKDNV